MTYVPSTKSTTPSIASGIAPQSIVAQGVLALSFSTGIRETSYAVTLTQNCSITVGFGTVSLDQLMTIDLIQGGSGGYLPTFANVSWPGGIAPSFNLAAGKQDMLQLRAVGSDIMGWPVSMGRLPLVQLLPTVPANITVVPGVNQNSVNASMVTAYPPVSGYNVFAGPASGAETTVPIAINVKLPFVDGGLTAGMTRFYKVAAVNGVGIGAMSAEASGTPLPAGSIPVAPSGVTAVAGNAQVTINALPVSAAPSVTGYSVQRGTSAGGESAAPIATNVSLPFIDSSVSNGVTYYYTISAINSVGAGPGSIETSATPTAPIQAMPPHYASFSTTDSVLYASPNALFNPGANLFDMQIHVRMADWSTSGYGGSGETCLWGCWDTNAANRLWRLGLTTTGAIRASWATGASSDPTAVSSVAITAAGNTDLWIRAAVTPTNGSVNFYTSVDGVNWVQLGSQQTATSSGAVYTPGTLPYLVVGSDASGGSSGNTAEQFSGRFYEARLYINGGLVTNPIVGAGGLTDSKGISYSATTGVGLV